MGSPFDFVKDVSFNKHNIFTEENQEDYIPIIINRAFSYYLDTILFSNEMNMNHHLDKQLQHDFYLHGLRKRKRYSSWIKKEVDQELEAISQYFQLSKPKAKEARRLLTSSQIMNIIEEMEKKKE